MTVVILLAAGTGSRMEMETPKQFAEIKGKTVMEYSMEIIQNNDEIACFFIVVREQYKNYVKNIAEKYSKFKGMVEGGDTRQKSVFNALKEIKNLKADKVLIHDSARPFSGKVFKNVISGLKFANNAIPVIQVKDTLYRIEETGSASAERKTEMVSRKNYYTVQTPQGFEFDLIYTAHLKAVEENKYDFTDDGSMWIKYIGNVRTVEGSVENIKITYPLELEIAEKIAEFME